MNNYEAYLLFLDSTYNCIVTLSSLSTSGLLTKGLFLFFEFLVVFLIDFGTLNFDMTRPTPIK